jgi:hypothetical protein
MTRDAWKRPLLRPPAIAIHDHGYMFRNTSVVPQFILQVFVIRALIDQTFSC